LNIKDQMSVACDPGNFINERVCGEATWEKGYCGIDSESAGWQSSMKPRSRLKNLANKRILFAFS
jgi:hypothetical protein